MMSSCTLSQEAFREKVFTYSERAVSASSIDQGYDRVRVVVEALRQDGIRQLSSVIREQSSKVLRDRICCRFVQALCAVRDASVSASNQCRYRGDDLRDVHCDGCSGVVSRE